MRTTSSPSPATSLLSAPPQGPRTPISWGIRSAGAFAQLPREEVGKRLGTEGLAFWDRISGREERPLRISEPPAVYEESLEFEYEIETLEPLLFVIRRFLDQLCLQFAVLIKRIFSLLQLSVCFCKLPLCCHGLKNMCDAYQKQWPFTPQKPRCKRFFKAK